MFDIGWSELVVIAVVALIAIGPKELPGVLRTVGQYMRKIRSMASEFQGQFQEAMREAEMADLKKSVDEMTDTAKSFTDFDPLASVKKEVESFSADPLATPPAASASPEAAGPGTPAPVSSDATIPPPSSDLAIAPEAPQPQSETAPESKPDAKPETKPETKPEPKTTTASGSGA
jgi:sec-independent protein translocase protein TatB